MPPKDVPFSADRQPCSVRSAALRETTERERELEREESERERERERERESRMATKEFLPQRAEKEDDRE